MKKIFIIILTTILNNLTAQVGINTNSPRATLDVNGDIVVNELIFPKNLEAITPDINDVYYLLVQSQEGDKNIRLLNVNDSKNPGIAALVTLKLKDPKGDWIESFNTKIDATKYALVVLSGYYTVDVGSENINALPGIGAFVKNGTWHINADYPALDRTNTTTENAWIISCSIFHKNYVKILPEQTIDMDQKTFKTAEHALL